MACTENVRMRLVLGAFGKKSLEVLDWMDLEHDECFPIVFSIVLKACGKSLVHSRSIRCVLKAFGKHSERKPFEVNMREVFGLFWNHTENIGKTNGKHSVIHWERHIRRTSLKNHTTFVYGKETEAHSGQCDRPITKLNSLHSCKD